MMKTTSLQISIGISRSLLRRLDQASADVQIEAVGDVIDDVTPDDPGLTHRPRRTCRKNVLYQGDWWVDHGDDKEE